MFEPGILIKPIIYFPFVVFTFPYIEIRSQTSAVESEFSSALHKCFNKGYVLSVHGQK